MGKASRKSRDRLAQQRISELSKAIANEMAPLVRSRGSNWFQVGGLIVAIAGLVLAVWASTEATAVSERVSADSAELANQIFEAEGPALSGFGGWFSIGRVVDEDAYPPVRSTGVATWGVLTNRGRLRVEVVDVYSSPFMAADDRVCLEEVPLVLEPGASGLVMFRADNAGDREVDGGSGWEIALATGEVVSFENSVAGDREEQSVIEAYEDRRDEIAERCYRETLAATEGQGIWPEIPEDS